MSQKKEWMGLYEDYKQVPLKEWTHGTPESLAALATDLSEISNNGLKVTDKKSFGVAILIAARIAHQCSVEEFCEFMETGDVPSIKLGKSEMQHLKGGGFGSWIRNNAAYVALGAVAVTAGVIAVRNGKAASSAKLEAEINNNRWEQAKFTLGKTRDALEVMTNRYEQAAFSVRKYRDGDGRKPEDR